MVTERTGPGPWPMVAIVAGLAILAAVVVGLTQGGPGDPPVADVTFEATTQDTTPTTPTPTPSSSATVAYPGQPPAGQVLWGASVPGNGDPSARLESPAGQRLDLRRTFFQWRHVDGWMLEVASEDVAAGRVPWLSIKPPPWQEVADGAHDDELDRILTSLDALAGPVWLTMHHEPEGGGGINRPDDPGGPAAHVAMNRHVRDRMDALEVDNVALAPVLMAYTWGDEAGRNPDDWWPDDLDGVYDFLGIDTYDQGQETLLGEDWSRVRDWAAARGIEVAVGEWNTSATGEAGYRAVREWHDAAIASDDDEGARVTALVVFDNPGMEWPLEGRVRDAFLDILAE